MYIYIVSDEIFSLIWNQVEVRNSRSIQRRITNDYSEPESFYFGGIKHIRVSATLLSRY